MWFLTVPELWEAPVVFCFGFFFCWSHLQGPLAVPMRLGAVTDPSSHSGSVGSVGSSVLQPPRLPNSCSAEPPRFSPNHLHLLNLSKDQHPWGKITHFFLLTVKFRPEFWFLN